MHRPEQQPGCGDDRSQAEQQGGRDAHTDWEVVERFGDIATLVRCTIHTGRTHQIRVHMKTLGHIVLGDSVYGWKPDPRLQHQPARVMLHAEHLVFVHPVSGRTIELRAPLPADMEAMRRDLRKVATGAATRKQRDEKAAQPKGKPAPPPFHLHEPRD